ncbi:MAG: hypothetical protein Q3974_02310 [Rothia sp. (in: high G+C Gram-positive bacteria)]|nr:hypothetical protein [Rothia sp. (in: high G+C Gram-positive bacteria)]
MNTHQIISRRTLAKGSAWAAPTVVASAVIPAYAASAQPTTLTSITWFYNASSGSGNVQPYTCNGNNQLRITQKTTGSYVTVSNIPTGSKLTNLIARYWLAVDSNTTFTRVSGTSTCWSVPLASGKTTTYNGVVFREYTSTYTCPISISGTSWTQPTADAMDFVSSCQASPTLTSIIYHYTQQVTLTSAQGTTTILTKDNGWTNQMT